MPSNVIDVWDVATFDPDLTSALEANAGLISSYWSESRRLYLEREAQTVRGPPEENRFGRNYGELKDMVGGMMEDRTVRCWHYTRLTDAEVADIRAEGMLPMTLPIIRRRLEAAVDAGDIDAATAAELYAASPYHTQFEGYRENRTWLTAQPYQTDDGGVEELLETWGGESVGFNHRSGPLRELLKGIGRPRVLEVAVPVSSTTRSHEIGCNVLDAYSFTIGCSGGWGGGADVVVVEPIPPEWIVDVHSEGDETFATLGCGYPVGFESDAG